MIRSLKGDLKEMAPAEGEGHPLASFLNLIENRYSDTDRPPDRWLPSFVGSWMRTCGVSDGDLRFPTSRRISWL